MSKEEVLSGNKLIAEFMGWHDEIIQSFTPPNDRHYFCSPQGQPREVFSYPILEDDLKYHSSWDWLMPVVEKIEEFEVSVTIKCNRVRLYGWFENNPNTTTLYEWNGGQTNDNKITSTWYAVTEFIKWYNKQSKQINQ